ncbi:MAG TPA: coenzyme F420-0:L-glutamate ligase [Anaerolineae bacterium]|nr:coenzyme F420-0:L-glutamate ligase [Anaerolineae bacterium]
MFRRGDVSSVELIPLPGLPLVAPGDDLAALVWQALQEAGMALRDGDILVLAQKVVSKAEGRWVDLRTVAPSARARALAQVVQKDPRLVEVVLRESREVLRAVPGVLIVEHRLGFVCANAGVDHSNVGPPPGAPPQRVGSPEDWVLLLPADPDASAARLRRRWEALSGARLGVLIIDSHGRAWRLGTVGVAIGLSGLPGLVDLRGAPDLLGRELRVTTVGVADELAAAASLVMGQAGEGTPVVHVRGFPYPLREGSLGELLRPKERDLFR